MFAYDKKIDTNGLHCPLASMYAKRAMTELRKGQLLYLITSDRASLNNIKKYSDFNLLAMVENRQDRSGVFHLLIKKPWNGIRKRM